MDSLFGGTPMSDAVTLEPVDEVPTDGRVCHYDELGEAAKATVPSLADDAAAPERPDGDESIADAFAGCDFVKYTEYYAVSAD